MDFKKYLKFKLLTLNCFECNSPINLKSKLVELHQGLASCEHASLTCSGFV
jgi:hypothetical protein